MKQLNDSEIRALLKEYDRLDLDPSEADEKRMREIMELVGPAAVVKIGRPVFSLKKRMTKGELAEIKNRVTALNLILDVFSGASPGELSFKEIAEIEVELDGLIEVLNVSYVLARLDESSKRKAI